MKEILLNDLPSLVRNKCAVSECARRDRWQSVAYRTAEVSGRMLLAGEEMFPEAVELELGASGWHRIYVCLYHLALAKALYEAGACKFICWNANHIAERLPVLAAVKRAGEKEKLFGEQPPLRRLHRVLAVGGRDISEFNPNGGGESAFWNAVLPRRIRTAAGRRILLRRKKSIGAR